MDIIHKIGRRKRSVARVYLSEGKGEITINNRPVESYFVVPTLRYRVLQAFYLTETEKKYDLKVKVQGGGITGQAEAIRLATSRALCEFDEQYRQILKSEGLLTRDSRVVERKKFGQKKARKKYQFSKR